MAWCTRCGKYFIVATGKIVNRAIKARGVFNPDIPDLVCLNCLKPGESYGGE